MTSEASSRHQALREEYYDLGKGPLDVTDELEADFTPLIDFDGQPMDLLNYQYKMGELNPLTVVVKQGTQQQKMTPQIYKNLRSVRHRVLVPVLNYYAKENGMLVLAQVHGSFRKWLDQNGWDSMLEGAGIERGMSPTLRGFIIDLWSLFSKVAKKGLYPIKITIDDVLVRRLKEVQVLSRNYFTPTEEEQLFSSIDAIVEMICAKSGCKLNLSCKEFCSYIKTKSTTLPKITNFPDLWTGDDKAAYLYHIIAGREVVREKMRKKVNLYSDIDWPRQSDEQIVAVIKKICLLPKNVIRKEDGTLRSKYDTAYPYDFVQLCRNTHKHFHDLPENIKNELGGSPQSFIRMIEYWDPMIWIKLYKEIGHLGRQV